MSNPGNKRTYSAAIGESSRSRSSTPEIGVNNAARRASDREFISDSSSEPSYSPAPPSPTMLRRWSSRSRQDILKFYQDVIVGTDHAGTSEAMMPEEKLVGIVAGFIRFSPKAERVLREEGVDELYKHITNLAIAERHGQVAGLEEDPASLRGWYFHTRSEDYETNDGQPSTTPLVSSLVPPLTAAPTDSRPSRLRIPRVLNPRDIFASLTVLGGGPDLMYASFLTEKLRRTRFDENDYIDIAFMFWANSVINDGKRLTAFDTHGLREVLVGERHAAHVRAETQALSNTTMMLRSLQERALTYQEQQDYFLCTIAEGLIAYSKELADRRALVDQYEKRSKLYTQYWINGFPFPATAKHLALANHQRLHMSLKENMGLRHENMKIKSLYCTLGLEINTVKQERDEIRRRLEALTSASTSSST